MRQTCEFGPFLAGGGGLLNPVLRGSSGVFDISSSARFCEGVSRNFFKFYFPYRYWFLDCKGDLDRQFAHRSVRGHLRSATCWPLGNRRKRAACPQLGHRHLDGGQ